jgi:YihY family inner membrane protein
MSEHRGVARLNRAVGAAGTGSAIGFETIRAVVRRYWDADGPSHSRALAYHSILALLAGLIGLIGLAGALDVPIVRRTVEEWLTRLSPGPSGRILRTAAAQGGSGAAAVVGLGTALIVGTRALAEFQRAADRLWGIEEDRPAVRRYLVGLGLAVSAGVLLAAGAMVLAGGEALAAGAGWGQGFQDVWQIVRWPLGALFAASAIVLLYRVAPRARPAAPALAAGAAVAIALWIVFTGLLTLYFSVSEGTTQTYGPLAGLVALALWAAFTSVALHIGVAVTARFADAGPPSTRAAAPVSFARD